MPHGIEIDTHTDNPGRPMDTTVMTALRVRHLVSAARHVLACVVFTALSGAAGAQGASAWATLGPAGGTVSAILGTGPAGALLYAGTPENGVYVSTDAGATWSAANAGLATAVAGRQALYAVYALATDTQYVYAATAAGLYYATLGPAPMWSALPAATALGPITSLLYDPASGAILASTSATDGVSVPALYVAPSLHSGAATLNWTAVARPAAVAGQAVGAVALVPPSTPATAASVLASAGSRVFSAALTSAAPGTVNWTDADPAAALSAGTITALAYSADFLQAYACSAGSAYYSGNVLATQALWSPATTPLSAAQAPVCNAFDPVPLAAGGAPQLVLGTDQGAWVSLDGVNFSVTGALPTSPSALSFAIALPAGSSPALYAGGGFGVSRTALSTLTAAANWTPSNGPASVAAGGGNARLNNVSVADTAVLGATLYAAAVDSLYDEVYASADGGATWTPTQIGGQLPSTEQVLSLAADTKNNVLYAATTQGLLAYLPATATWSVVGSGVIAGRIGALTVGSTALFVGTDNGMFALPLSAQPSSATPVGAGLSGASVRALLDSNGTLVAATIAADSNNYVYFTTEASAAQGSGQWQLFGTGTSGTSRITSMLLVGTNLIVGTNGSLVLYASVNSAWSPANTSSDPTQQIADGFGAVFSLYSDGTSIYAATLTNGVYVSPVGGTTFAWTPFNGAGSTALPAMEVHSLRASGTTLYASTRAGVAIYTNLAGGPAPVTPPASTPAATGGSSSGGGAVDGGFAALTAVAVLAMAMARRRRRR